MIGCWLSYFDLWLLFMPLLRFVNSLIHTFQQRFVRIVSAFEKMYYYMNNLSLICCEYKVFTILLLDIMKFQFI